MRAFVSRHLPGDALSRLPSDVQAVVWPGDGPPPYDTLAREAAASDGLLCLLTDRVDDALLGAAPRLRVVSQMAVGVDNIDLHAATARGIPVGHTPGVLAETTADLAWALVLAASRRITEAERFVRAGRWTTWGPELLCGVDVHGGTLGVVGMGAIGRAVARRAKGFDMSVVYASPTTRDVDDATATALDDLLAVADVVSLHCALTPATRSLIGARELALMKPTAVLVNAARGGVVDEAALVQALRAGRLFAAGLDVYATEPLPARSPLLELPNVVLTPHIGSASLATRARMARMAVDNLVAGLRGRPLPHCANPAVLA